jgi:hypothetical protein
VEDILNYMNSLWLWWYGHVERMQTQRTAKTSCSRYNGRNKEKRKTTWRMGRRGLRGFKCIGNKKQAADGQGLSVFVFLLCWPRVMVLGLKYLKMQFKAHNTPFMLVPVAARSKMWVYSHSIAGIAGSNPTGSLDVCLLWMMCVVRYLCVGLIACPEESYRAWRVLSLIVKPG